MASGDATTTSQRLDPYRRGIGGHRRAVGRTDEWYTPPHIFGALGLHFDLDPCSPPGGVPWVPAGRHLSVVDDGLAQPWEGRVWLNPPYGSPTGAWLRRLAAHGDGIALVFARTDTAWFHDVAPAADLVCFLAGRLTLVPGDEKMRDPGRTNGNSGAPSMLMAFGDDCAEAVAGARLGMSFSVRAPRLLGQAGLWDRT